MVTELETLRQIVTLLKAQLKELKASTLFTFSLDRGRVITALLEYGILIPLVWIGTVNVAPGATQTVTFTVPPGFIALLASGVLDTDLPWSMAHRGFHDTPTTGTPTSVDPNMPPHVEYEFPGYWPLRYTGIDEWTNNHLANDGRGHDIVMMAIIRKDVWDMIRTAILNPVVERLREEAERRGEPLR